MSEEDRTPTAAEEAVARKLCGWAEYHEANWRLYLVRARQIIDLVERNR